MRQNRIFVIGICLVILMPASGALANWVSPGEGTTYTLEWLAQHTNSVQKLGPSTYELVDNLQISMFDTLQINQGETLFFNPTKKIVIHGNFYVNGLSTSPVLLESKMGPSIIPNIDWSYTGSNDFLLSELEIVNITMEYEDEGGNDIEFESNAPPGGGDPLPYPFSQMPISHIIVSSPGWQLWCKYLRIVGLEPGWWQDDDNDGIPNAYEDIIGLDKHNPADAFEDADGDGINNLDEFSGGTSPVRKDTDFDDIQDNRDPQPTNPNRKFAFIFEVTDFEGAGNDLGSECNVIAREIDNMGFFTYLYSDDDYRALAIDKRMYSANGCSWSDFKWAVKDFRDYNNNDNIGDTGDVGKPNTQMFNYGNDIVVIYLDAHGKNEHETYWIYGTTDPVHDDVFHMCFYNSNKDEDEWISEDKIMAELKPLGGCIELLWVSMCDSFGWKDDIVNLDGLNAGDRIVILTTDKTFNGAIIWNRWESRYTGTENRGFEGAWNLIPNDQLDDHVLHDCQPNKKLYLS